MVTLLSSIAANAHDFEVDGFFYNILSEEDRTVEVTYKGDSYYEYSEYSGNVAIPANVTYEGTTYSVTTIGNGAFAYCTGLTSVTIGNSVTTIGDYAFYECSSLTNVTIGNSVTTIGDYAFYECSSLTNVTIGNSVTTIENCAFSKCNGLTSIVVAEDNTIYDSREDCNAIIETATNTLITGCKKTVIPNSVTTIGDNAFSDCNGLTSIEIPNSVTTIGNSAFSSCWNLTSIEIPNSVTTIGNGAFNDCRNLKSVTIGNSVTTIGDGAFLWCNGIRSVTIGNSVTTIENSAFWGCIGLTSIEIPNSVTTIGENAFLYCSGLTSIVVAEDNTIYDSREDCNAIIETATNTLITGCKKTVIPNSVTTIGAYAFYYCEGLTSIEIPNRVTTIGEWAFYECNNLTTITSLIPATELFTVESTVFGGVSKNSTLYVPAGAKETYAATDGWKDFTNIVELAAEQFELTVSAAGYATLYLDFNAEIPYGVEAYTANTVKGNKLMLQQVTGTLPANTAVIVKAKQGSYTFEQSFEETEAIENNLFRGSVEDEYITPAKNAKYYVLAMKDGVVGMYEDALTGGTFKNNAHKAYLVLGEKNLGIYDEEVDTENPGMQLSNSYYFDFSGTTAIETVITEVEDNIYYDLSGRRVENPTQGIYIVNGKKVLVK